MFDGMKYIVWDGPWHQSIVMFESMSHSEMAHTLDITDKVLSAGFVFNDKLNDIRCHGRSTSLKVNSDPERDTMLLKQRLGWDREDLAVDSTE